LTTALEEASHDFNPEPDRVKAIILVSGSGETCQRDPCALVNQWQIEGLVITVYAIGLNVEEGARQQLQCVAEAGGGAYYDAATATDVAHALTQIQQTLKQEEVVIPAAVAMMPTPTATPLPTATATRVVVFHTPASISETTDTAPSPESPPAEKTATPPPLQGRIAFSTMRADLKNEIFVMSAGGQNPTRVTRFAASAVFPAWSPDGWWLAFASNHEGDYDIYVNNVSGNSLTRLTNTPGEDNKPAWSPDGARLVFASARNDAGCDVDCKFELYLMDADGSQQANLTNHPANDDSPDWSPDGQQILFSSDRDGNDEIYTWDLREQVLTRLTNHPERDTSPVWSPDGRRIAFESYRDGNFEIYVMDADGTNPRRLTKNAIWDAWPAWSPDGARLVFASQRDGADFDLYTITAEGGHEIRLTDDPTVDLHPSWAAR
jgi:hypothetical protein